MAWRGPRTTTGRGGNGTIVGRRDTDPARGNGYGFSTSRGAHPTDLFEGGGRPTNLVAGVQGREQAVQEYRPPPPTSELEVPFERRPIQMERSPQ